MGSRRIDTKKPKSDRDHVLKRRKCLMCGSEFHSRHFGERVCLACKETAAWRSGDMAA